MNCYYFRNWLNKNSELAKERTDAEQPIVEEINRLKESLIGTLKLRAIQWECGWNISHFRGCLEAFQSLSNHYPEILKNLEGKYYILKCKFMINMWCSNILVHFLFRGYFSVLYFC